MRDGYKKLDEKLDGKLDKKSNGNLGESLSKKLIY
jgi:hypothetical protein